MRGTTPSHVALDYRYAAGATAGPVEIGDSPFLPFLRPVAADLPDNHLPWERINILCDNGSVTFADTDGDCQKAIWMTRLNELCESPEVLEQSPVQDGK
jgi:hypothetical protein